MLTRRFPLRWNINACGHRITWLASGGATNNISNIYPDLSRNTIEPHSPCPGVNCKTDNSGPTLIVLQHQRISPLVISRINFISTLFGGPWGTYCPLLLSMSQLGNVPVISLERKEKTQTMSQTTTASLPEGGLDGWLAVLGVLVFASSFSYCHWHSSSALALFATFGAALSFGVFQDYYTVISLISGDKTCWIPPSVHFWMNIRRQPSVGLALLSSFWILQWDCLLESFTTLGISRLQWYLEACSTSFRAPFSGCWFLFIVADTTSLGFLCCLSQNRNTTIKFSYPRQLEWKSGWALLSFQLSHYHLNTLGDVGHLSWVLYMQVNHDHDWSNDMTHSICVRLFSWWCYLSNYVEPPDKQWSWFCMGRKVWSRLYRSWTSPEFL